MVRSTAKSRRSIAKTEGGLTYLPASLCSSQEENLPLFLIPLVKKLKTLVIPAWFHPRKYSFALGPGRESNASQTFFICPCGAIDTRLRGYDDFCFTVINFYLSHYLQQLFYLIKCRCCWVFQQWGVRTRVSVKTYTKINICLTKNS